MELKQYYDAQVAVLGSLMIEPDKLAGMIMQRTCSEDFADPSLKHVYDAARSLYLSREPIDPVTILGKAGAVYDKLIRQILALTPTAANVEAYIEALRESATLGKLQAAADKVLIAVTVDEARDALGRASALLADRPRVRITSFAEGLANFFDWLNDKTPPEYLKWGLAPLDKRLYVEQGDFVILGADASVGKTALAAQLAYNMALSGKRVGFFSLETSGKKMYDRMFSRLGEIKLSQIKHKRLSEYDCKRLMGAIGDPEAVKLSVIDAAGMSVQDIRSLTIAGRYDVIYVDYVQIVRADGKERKEVVANISMGLHSMAQELAVTVIGLSQLTPPDAKTNRWRLNHKEDLRESRQLINDADVIMVMSRTDEERPNFRELAVDKNKEGALGIVKLNFEPEIMRFQPPATKPKARDQMNMTELSGGDEDNPFTHDGPRSGFGADK